MCQGTWIIVRKSLGVGGRNSGIGNYDNFVARLLIDGVRRRSRSRRLGE